MSEQPIYVTRDGLKKLEDELEYLRTVKRAEVAQRLHDAMGEGDIDENAEYDDAKNEQSFVEGRILTLETMIKNAVIIQEGKHRDQVVLGSTVTIVEDGGQPETYHLVGSLGKRVGETVTVSAPAGMLSFQIIAIH
jgi:transcription elongation factor GreA